MKFFFQINLIKKLTIYILFLIFSTNPSYAIVNDAQNWHHADTFYCTDGPKDPMDWPSTYSYRVEWPGGNSPRRWVYVRDYIFFGGKISGPFTFNNPRVKDLDNDGTCEVVVDGGFGEWRWTSRAGWGVEVPVVYKFDGITFKDVSDKYAKDLITKRLKEVLEIIDDYEKNNLELFYSQSDGYGIGKAAWAEYLQLNPSQEGIDYFFKRTLGKFDIGYLYQLEILMCKNFVWDLATCSSKPLTSIDRSKLLNGK